MSNHYLETMYKRATPISMVHRNRLKSICETFEENVPMNSSWADVGCATGFLIEHVVKHSKLTFFKVVGYDHARDLVSEANTRGVPGVEFRYLELNDLDEPKETFDVVSCFETLEHVSDYKIAIANLIRHVREGGVLILTIPNEVGFIGLGKFLGRMAARRSPYDDFFEGQSQIKYIAHLIGYKRIAGFRRFRSRGYGPHLGFDYRDVIAFLQNEYVDSGMLSSLTVRSVALNTGKIVIMRR